MPAPSTCLLHLSEEDKTGDMIYKRLPNGKNAWRTEGKKGKSRNWNGNNRVAAEGDTTDSDDDFNEGPQQSSQTNKNSAAQNKQSGVVNILLYVGFLLFAVGLILTLVGMGDRGFKTEELKLIGPTLIICGLVFALLRILFCSCDTCTKPKPQDEKKLLTPSTDTVDGAGTANPAFQADPEPTRMPPLRQVQRAPKVSAAEPSEPSPPMQSIDDEVEEDMALGLKVDYAEELTPKEPSVSRPPSESTVRVVSESTVRVVSEMPASTKEGRSQISDGDGEEESEEVILNPAKLRKT
ncbi:hypothetical protein FHG87_005351 [Trinorchestia longiramus]|nr:hypothetical protein FHG87_005351 [Trinorchestia longiramus]